MKRPKCDFPLLSASAVSRLIEYKLVHHKPLSLIRLGDGEGVLLSMHKESPKKDLEYFSMHFGPYVATSDRLIDLRARMVNAILDSDVIGVRDDIVGVDFGLSNYELPPEQFIEEFRKSFKLRDCEKDLPYDGSRRIALLHRSLGDINFGDQIQYCSSWVHYNLHLSGSIFKLLIRQKKIGLITSRYELCPRLEELFGLEVSCWNIPDMFQSIGVERATRNYIQKLESILQRQLVEFPGMFFLVGGGLYGKLYCSLIKSQGGIALDVGSLLDAWTGIHSRPAVYSTLFPTKYDNRSAPNELYLSNKNVRRMVGPIGMSRKILRKHYFKRLNNRKFGRALIKYFEKIYCINLDSRPDRWLYVDNHFSRFGLKDKVERFSGVDVRNDPMLQGHEKLLKENYSLLAMCGCMLSHRKIVESARLAKLKSVLVFEDDVRILQQNILNLNKSLRDLAKCDWDIFYLGATYHWALERAGPYLVKVSQGALATHAIAYNHTVFDKILDILPSTPMEFLESDRFEVNALDKWLQSDLFDHRRFFGTNPIMVAQALQESDIAFNQMDGIEQCQIDLFYNNLEGE